MTDTIVIENDLVKHIRTEVVSQVSLLEWMPYIEKKAVIETPVLPTGTRKIRWDPTGAEQHLAILIEQEPQMVNMNFEETIFRISIPYTRFIFDLWTTDPTNNMSWTIDDYRIFWSKFKYTNPLTKDMTAALMPNVYNDGRICFGSTAADMDQSLSERLDQTVNEFWVSQFNRDLTIRRPREYSDFRAWQKASLENQSIWTKWVDLDTSQTPNAVNGYMGNSRDSRFQEMVAADPIPAVPLGATFGRITEWWAEMSTNQRNRLLVSAANLETSNYDDENDDEDPNDPAF